jgi:hypothetical protein
MSPEQVRLTYVGEAAGSLLRASSSNVPDAFMPRHDRSGQGYGRPTDMYSTGVVIYVVRDTCQAPKIAPCVDRSHACADALWMAPIPIGEK